MTRIFESKNAQKARVEAEIAARSERFRACPTLKIGTVTVINPIFEGPNPFEDAELLDPENEGVLREPLEERRRKRAKSDSEFLKTRVVHGLRRNPRYSAPPLMETVCPWDEDEDDPFRKDPVVKSTAIGNSFFLHEEEEKRRARRRYYAPVDFLQVIPEARLDVD